MIHFMIQHYGLANPGKWLRDELDEYICEVNRLSNDSSLFTSILSIVKDPTISRFLDNKFWTMIDFICSKDHLIEEVIFLMARIPK